MDNQIKIPWYKARVKIPQAFDNPTTSSFPDVELPDFDKRRKKKRKKKKRGRTKQRRPQRELVRERVKETVRERSPSRVPGRVPILDPRGQTDPKEDYGDNPYRSPAMNPIPLPLPRPNPAPDTRRDPGATPGVNQKQPMPQAPYSPSPNGGFALPYEIPSIIPPPGYISKYTPQQEQWGNDFITNVEFVARVTGIQGRRLYVFMRDYNYETGSLPQFTTDAQAEFGAFGGAVLTTIVAAKMLGEMWGKRALNSFAPMIKLDDEYMEDYFGTQIY